MNILGLDYGLQKIGVAIADTDSGVARPLTTIANTGRERLVVAIQKIISDYRIDRIVVGLPVFKADPIVASVIQEIICYLEEATGVNVVAHNEDFTSKAAQKMGIAAASDDPVAAMIMLQSYIETL